MQALSMIRGGLQRRELRYHAGIIFFDGYFTQARLKTAPVRRKPVVVFDIYQRRVFNHLVRLVFNNSLPEMLRDLLRRLGRLAGR